MTKTRVPHSTVALAAVAVPALVLSAVGLSHPRLLNAETADWWATMHLLLVPLFPLLGVSVWVLLRDDKTPVGWAGRVAAIAYVVFYGGLDAVSGIAAGTVVRAGAAPDSDVVTSLFAAGRGLGIIGGYAFFVAVILVLGSAWRRGARGLRLYAAAPVLLAAGFLFTSSHIYWPKGGVTMIAFAVGFVLVELTRRGSSATRSAQP
jgi:hypothetical protein